MTTGIAIITIINIVHKYMANMAMILNYKLECPDRTLTGTLTGSWCTRSLQKNVGYAPKKIISCYFQILSKFEI
jgi:hypothetical protein